MTTTTAYPSTMGAVAEPVFTFEQMQRCGERRTRARRLAPQAPGAR